MTPPAPAPRRSYAFQNAVFYLIVPAAVVLVPWVWFGRAFFGAGGWYLIFFLMTVTPVVAIVLVAAGVLAFTQGRTRATGLLTTRQACAQVLVWVGLAAFGFFVVDFGDAADSAQSAFTMLTGGTPQVTLSHWLSLASAVLAAVAWIWLVVELVAGNVAQKRRRDAEAAAWHAAYWQRGYPQGPQPPGHPQDPWRG